MVMLSPFFLFFHGRLARPLSRTGMNFDIDLSRNDKIVLTIDAQCGILWIRKNKRKEYGEMNRDRVIRITKYLVDFMFVAGILVTLTLPWSIRWAGTYLECLAENYGEIVTIYFVLGILALAIIWELRKMFRTVLARNCFVRENVAALKHMSYYSGLIVLMSIVRTIVYTTIAMLVVILVFVIAGLFCQVLAQIFDQAIQYKEENDLTI